MTKLFNLFSRISFTVVLASLFLPFMVVQCANQEIVKATGVQLITGDIKMKDPSKQFNPNNPFESTSLDDLHKNLNKTTQGNKTPEHNPYIIGIGILGLLGLVISFLKMPYRKEVLMGIAATGIILLVVLSQTLEVTGAKDLAKENNPLLSAYKVKVSMQEGFYLCLVGFFMVFIEPIIILFKDTQYE
ncbi:hypothetical protein VB264_04575 [Arcicella aquatica]|uniref:Uncharacterized protein n=1 Tax=Arcicella aquatica TaxID=217141 RepID=A0ABU5QJY7_9BACT|nr:hypothetical protein [Arcicella aquatica]MEA5257049.1 hypothetical protein [Arcicella aquatica]